MSQDFEISPLQDASVLSLDDMKDAILINPDYQREGQVWSLSKKQLFIDTLLNKYDVPKLYFHRLVGIHSIPGKGYSIIDGRQRLETIWDFLCNKFPLSDDFRFLEDASVPLQGKYFKDFASVNARLATRLYGRSLSVMIVTTDDLDYIEDMFTRLNDGVPLNAAEKRNSFGGPLPRASRHLAQHEFFANCIRVSSSRYRHLDISAKMLWIAHEGIVKNAIPDTKKATLDTFFRTNRNAPESQFQGAITAVKSSLCAMATVFGAKDMLLRSSGTVTVYFLLFLRHGHEAGRALTRNKLVEFENLREENREFFKNEADSVDFSLIEYDELAQSSNDAASIRARFEKLEKHLGLSSA